MFGVDFVDLFSSLTFLDFISPVNFCCKTGLMVLNSLDFCLSEKLLISPSILNEILSGYNKLGCRFFHFRTLNISCHPFWLAEFLLKDQLLSVWAFSCMLLVAFPLWLLIFFLLVFVSLIGMCLGYGSTWVYPVWDTLRLLDFYFLFHVGEIFNYNLFKTFLIPFFFLFFFWTPII